MFRIGQQVHPGGKCMHRAGRRGCQAYIFRSQRLRPEDERDLRRRDRGLSGSHGDAHGNGPGRAERACVKTQDDISDRVALRGLRQDRRSVPDEGGGREGGHSGIDIPGRSEPDDKRTGLREKDRRKCRISRRAALFPSGAEKEIFRDSQASARPDDIARKLTPLCSPRCGAPWEEE